MQQEDRYIDVSRIETKKEKNEKKFRWFNEWIILFEGMRKEISK